MRVRKRVCPGSTGTLSKTGSPSNTLLNEAVCIRLAVALRTVTDCGIERTAVADNCVQAIGWPPMGKRTPFHLIDQAELDLIRCFMAVLVLPASTFGIDAKGAAFPSSN